MSVAISPAILGSHVSLDPQQRLDDSALMRRAIELARSSIQSGGGPFGAVVARDGVIVAEGQNRVTLWNDPTAHAEVVAIRAACKALDVALGVAAQVPPSAQALRRLMHHGQILQSHALHFFHLASP